MIQSLAAENGLAFFRKGNSGEKILWLHGYTMDHTVFQPLWDALPEYDHYGIDLPGHGQSRPLSPGESLPALGREIGTAALKFGINHVVGLSFGGMVALQVLIEFPDRFASLTLNAAPLGGGPQDRFAKIKNNELRRLYQAGTDKEELVKFWLEPPPDIFTGLFRFPERLEKMRETVLKHSWKELDHAAMANLYLYRQEEQKMAGIKSRTLILTGENDMEIFKRSAEIIRRSIPGSTRVYADDCFHLALLEDPQACIGLMRSFALSSPENPKETRP